MTMVKKLRNRLLVYLVFSLTLVRVAIARIWPFAGPRAASPSVAVPSGMREGMLLRIAPSAGHNNVRRHYALEVTGGFPYLRVNSLSRRAVAVPMETAALSEALVPDAFDLRLMTSPALVQSAATSTQSTRVTEFLRNCESCTSCHSCTSCSSCTCGCSSCSTCSSCGSCGTCGACTSCGPCSSCTSCGGCGGCSSCASCGCSSCFACSSCFCASGEVVIVC